MTSSRPVSVPPVGGTGQLITASLLSTASPSSQTQPCTELIAKFLGMIPRSGLSVAHQEVPSISLEKISLQERTPQERVRKRREQNGDIPKLLKATQTTQHAVTCVAVRLKTETVKERARAIVQAAKDCKRLRSPRATAVYSLLVTAALAHHVAIRPEVTVTPNRLVEFLIVDELALLLNLGRATIYRALDDLKVAGLVDHRAWCTTSGVRKRTKKQASAESAASYKAPQEPVKNVWTAAAGTLIDIVLTPKQGTRARVTAQDLRHRGYRNLDADRRIGRTAWQWMVEVQEVKRQVVTLEARVTNLRLNKGSVREIDGLERKAEQLRQSIPIEVETYKINHLLRWTLCISDQKPVTLTVSAQQEAVYRLGDLQLATPQQRGELIDERARALCIMVGDGMHNLGFWRWLLWRVTELEYIQPGAIQTFSATLTRLLVDLREWGGDADTRRPLKSPAALFIARLKRSGWWDELKAIEVASLRKAI